MLFGLLGGLGSRARRGFGSVAITSLNEKTFNFQNSEDYFEILKKQIASIQLAPSMPLITALNDAIQVAKAGEAPDPRRLMDQLGGAYKEARKKPEKAWPNCHLAYPWQVIKAPRMKTIAAAVLYCYISIPLAINL
nr:hypothetical protein [Methylomarinum sp. Ch1-1]MDP4521428.1 hypothetical protein [Methylomarinum sp. Ch1-1]